MEQFGDVENSKERGPWRPTSRGDREEAAAREPNRIGGEVGEELNPPLKVKSKLLSIQDIEQGFHNDNNAILKYNSSQHYQDIQDANDTRARKILNFLNGHILIAGQI